MSRVAKVEDELFEASGSITHFSISGGALGVIVTYFLQSGPSSCF